MATKTVTIASGETTSTPENIEDYKVFGIQLPSAFTGSTITFEVSDTKDGPYVALYAEDDSQVSISVSAGRAYGLDSSALELAAFTWMRLVSGSSEGAARTLILHMKK